MKNFMLPLSFSPSCLLLIGVLMVEPVRAEQSGWQMQGLTFLQEHLEAQGLRVDRLLPSATARLPTACHESGMEVQHWAGPETRWPLAKLRIVAHGRCGARSVRVPIVVDAFAAASVMVAAETLRAGESIRADQVQSAWRPTSRIRGVPASKAELTAGLVPKSTLVAGAVVLREDLREPPYVNVGDQVHATVSYGGVRLGFTTQSRSNGHLGDRVLVVGLDGESMVRATVKGRGVVHVVN